jgi:hypothetical protein
MTSSFSRGPAPVRPVEDIVDGSTGRPMGRKTLSAGTRRDPIAWNQWGTLRRCPEDGEGTLAIDD